MLGSRNGRIMRRVTRAVAPLAAVLLVVALPAMGALPSGRATAATHLPPPIPPEKLVPFRWQVPRKTPAPRPFRRYNPAVDSRLPGAGSAVVDLAAGARTATASARTRVVLRRAGTLPILVGAPVSAGTPAIRFAVHVTDQRTAQAAGVHGVLFTVTPSRPGPVTVEVDDSSFAAAFGGDYAARLHLVRLPACALTTPRLARCQVQTPAGGPSMARVASAAGPLVMADTSGPSGSAGDYTATSLSPAGTWSSGGSTGSFGYTYPIKVPAAIGGSTPNVDLSYDSSTQDGRTAGTNNQSSWIGDGWDSSGNFVERSYESCSDDPTSGAPQYSGDECWKGQVLTLSLNGQSTAIVQDDTTHAFRLANDSSTTTVDRLTNCPNGTYNNECWRVTENGIQYYFGLNELPGWSSGNQTTQSAWTVPVYGSHPHEPCNAATFAASSCLQGWRWNLDYVVDLHGNATAYYYQPEYNNYGADMQTTPVKYTRGGYLTRIDYGMTAGTIYSAPAPEQILFNVAERCIPGTPSGSTCSDSQFNVADAAYWPDVPIDQDCWLNNTGSCPNHAPTFWSRKRLSSIVTQVLVNGKMQQADEYDLTQSFPDGGDHAPTLWLSSIQHTGLDTSAGGSGPVSTFPVTFQPVQLPNRVGTIPHLPAMYHDRIQDITTETGAKITVTYNPATCTPANVPSDPSTNTANCFPVYWTPYGQSSPELDWFQKYTVSSVLTQDLHNANPDGTYPELLTTYTYPANGAAWHYDDNELVKPAYRTYGQFRGYAWVQTRTGDPNVFHYTNGVRVYDQPTLTRTYYLRGMSQNTPTGTGGTTVTVTSQDGKYSVTDNNALAGQAFETDTYTDATGTTLHSATVTIPVILGPTASRARSGLPPLTAQMVRTSQAHTSEAVSYGWRDTETDTFYNTTLGQPTTGMPVQVDDRGEVADPANVARCTWTRYAANTAESLVLPAETITNAQDCTSPGATPTGPLISDTRTSYDGHDFTWDGASPAGAPPTNGDPTTVARATGPAGTFTTMATTSYDSYGRPLVVTRTPDSREPDGSSLSQTTTTAYTPVSGALPTSTQTTVQVTAGASPTYQTTTKTFDPARNLPVKEISPAQLETDMTYDALGRLTAVWLPNESRAANAPPNDTFGYSLSQTGPTVTTSGKLLDNGSYQVSETLYDALLRTRQTQVAGENSSATVTDTQYNSLGATVVSNNDYAVSGAPGSALAAPAPTGFPNTIVTDYDGLGRAGLVTDEHNGVATSATITAYAGDRTTVIPPAGGVTRTTYTNARGQTTELDEYTTAPSVTGGSASGYSVSGGTFDKTSYTYSPAGQQASVTGPDGSTWSFSYDLLGRETQQTDPDAGTSSYRYDDAGNLVSATDARDVTLSYTYDLLGRKLTATDNGFEYASWLYDTIQAGKLTSSTRYVPGVSGGYTVGYTGYTSLGNPTGTKITLPASEAPLPTSYTTTYGYTGNDQALQSQTDPRIAGLAGETITYGYDALGNPFSTTGINVYVGKTVYTSYGEPSQVTLGDTTNPAYLTYGYDDQTRRLTSVQTDRTQAPGPTVDLTSYTYDTTGNITSVSDQQSESGNTVTDTQCYLYDGLGRLTQAWTDTAGVNPAGAGGTGGCKTSNPTAAALASGPFAYWQSYRYNAAGDRVSETDHAVNGAAGDTTTAYANGGTPAGTCADTAVRPHMLTQTTTTGPTGTTTDGYCYDAAGNMVSRPGQTLTWDDQGELASVTQGTSTTSYIYDANGSQLIRRDPGKTTLFTGDTQIVVNTSVSPPVLLGAVRSYAVAGTGAAIAVRSSLPGGGTDYLISDPHGTATLAMDINTQAVTRQQYTPYGEPLGTTGTAGWPDPAHGYLGKPVDASTGYTDLGARKYDPSLGRFISRDPLLETSSPQQLGGYTYAADNPVSGADPSGETCVSDDNGGCLRISGGDGSAPGSGNTDQGTSSADQCWGPGGNWICGSGSGSGSSSTCKPGTPGCAGPVVPTCKPGTPGCYGPVYHAPPATQPSSGGCHGFWGCALHVVKQAASVVGNVTGVTDAINCIKNPTAWGCLKAVVKLGLTGAAVFTAGSSLVGSATAEGGATLAGAGAGAALDGAGEASAGVVSADAADISVTAETVPPSVTGDQLTEVSPSSVPLYKRVFIGGVVALRALAPDLGEAVHEGQVVPIVYQVASGLAEQAPDVFEGEQVVEESDWGPAGLPPSIWIP